MTHFDNEYIIYESFIVLRKLEKKMKNYLTEHYVYRKIIRIEG